MRPLFVLTTLVLTIGALNAEVVPGGKKAQISGPHLCCAKCEKIAKGLLAKVDGITEVQTDTTNKTVTFTAKDLDAANKALDAMMAGGFSGSLKFGDDAVTREAKKASTDKVNAVTVNDVHVCCGQCVSAIGKVFGKDLKVSITKDKGPQQNVTVTGKDLTPAGVLEALNKAGFNGTIAEKK